MRTKEQWLKDFSHPCHKDNKYEHHPYGCMVVKPNNKEVAHEVAEHYTLYK